MSDELDAELLKINPLNDRAAFVSARKLVREKGGAKALRELLEQRGFVDAQAGTLTTGVKPFNVFARIGAGVMKPPGMEEANATLGALGEKFVVAGNRPENDEPEHVNSSDPEWVGKASMSLRHKFLTTKDLSWTFFNVLAFGLDGDAAGLREAIQVVEELERGAKAFASATAGWAGSSPEQLGLFFHCFPHCSVNSLHMHILDLTATGPTYKHLGFKNLPLADVLAVLRDELADAEKAEPAGAKRGDASCCCLL